MSVSLLNILIYVPLAVVAVIVGIIYFISGYKRGLWKSLISLAATVASVFSSILLSNLISPALTGPVMKLIPEDVIKEITKGFGILEKIVNNIIEGIVGAVLSLLLFGLILLILLIVTKLLSNRIPVPENGDTRYFGMAVRAIDTVLVALMLLIPVYGTLATFSPIVAPIVQISDEEENEAFEYIKCIDSHPVTAVYRTAPCKWVIESLTDLSKENGDMNLYKTISVFSDIMSRINDLTDENGKPDIKALSELFKYLNKRVFSEKWCYDMVFSVKNQLSEQLKELTDDDTVKAEIRQVVDFLDMTRKEFVDTTTSVTEFFDTVIDEDISEFIESKDADALSEDYYKDLGALLNSSHQMICLKKILYTDKATELFSMHYAPSEAKARAVKYIEKHFGDGKVSEEDYSAEGLAFTILSSDSDFETVVKAFSIHPLFGTDSFIETYE